MTKLHESHTIKTVLHTRLFPYSNRSRAGLVWTLNKHGQVALKMLPTSVKLSHRSNYKWDTVSPNGLQAFCCVRVQPRNPLFLSLNTRAHTDAHTHRHTNIFPHGKVSRIVLSGLQRISQLIQHHTKSLSSLLASPNKLSGETSKQNKAPWVQQLVRPAPNQTIRSTAQSERL